MMSNGDNFIEICERFILAYVEASRSAANGGEEPRANLQGRREESCIRAPLPPRVYIPTMTPLCDGEEERTCSHEDPLAYVEHAKLR